MDGVLKSFERQLEMLRARLELPKPALPLDLWAWSTRPLLAALPQPSCALRNRGLRRRCRSLGWRLLVFALAVHCQHLPTLWWVSRARRGNETRRRFSGWPRGSRSFAPSSAPQRIRALVAFGPVAEVLPTGSAASSKLLPFRALHNREARSRSIATAFGPLTPPGRAIGDLTDRYRGPCRAEPIASGYPLRLEETLASRLSRWLWLVKWVLAIPHFIVLTFLWIAFVGVAAIAFFAILFTGRYPRSLFEFNAGVLRWSWRVGFYSYSALATDQYPPFTLADVSDYPARLQIEYPQSLSRGLVLVKWWLLALPQYLVVGVLAGGGWAIWTGTNNEWLSLSGGGLIGLLVAIAAIVLLFTGRYPNSIYEFVLGMNRWVFRVAAYASLMTDDYPPFRLDMGGTEPAVDSAGTDVIPPTPAPTPTSPAA